MKKAMWLVVGLLCTHGFAKITLNPPHLILPDLEVGKTGTFDVRMHITSGPGTGLTYSFRSLEPWMKMQPDGVVLMTPPPKAKGQRFVFFANVSDGTDGGATMQVEVTVISATIQCPDGLDAHFLGTTEDKTNDIFSCPHR